MIAMQTEVLWHLGYVPCGYALQVLDWSAVKFWSTELFITLATVSRFLAELMLVIQAQALLDTSFPEGVFLVFMFFLFDAITAVASAMACKFCAYLDYHQIKELSTDKNHVAIGLGVVGVSVLYTAFDISRMVFLLRQDLLVGEVLQNLQNFGIASNLVLQTGSLASHTLIYFILDSDSSFKFPVLKFGFLATASFLVFSAILQAAIPTMSHSLASFAWQLDLAVLVNFRFFTKPAETTDVKLTTSEGEKSPDSLLRN